MSDRLKQQQTSDAPNSSGFGTNQLSSRQPDVLKANKLKGGTANEGRAAEPSDRTGAR
jgi:hypothetical protein